MQVYQSLAEFKATTHPVITVGIFDGVHVGHQKILSRLRTIADKNGGQVVLLTFHPHPRKVLFPELPVPDLLNTLDEKINLLESYGVDHLIIQPFTTGFSMLEYDDFVKEILVTQLAVDTLVIGYDHQFGRNRLGNIQTLIKLAGQLDFKVIEIPEQDIDHAAVSSTRIRNAIKLGDVSTAAELLGYNYCLNGIVVHGMKLGRILGYPTANLQVMDADKLIPANGIYAVKVKHGEVEYGGMLNIGTRPTFDDGPRSIEVNIFDFDGDVYGQTLQLEFIQRIRDELKFDSVDALIESIHQDKLDSLHILSARK